MRVNKWKLGGTYEGGHEYDNPHTPIMVEKNWPDPEIRGKGVVISKDGKVKTDGGNTKQCGGECSCRRGS